MSFEEALEKLNADSYPGEGFYVAKKVSTCTNRSKMSLKCVDASTDGLTLFSFAAFYHLQSCTCCSSQNRFNNPCGGHQSITGQTKF